jgi:hypothetical protein
MSTRLVEKRPFAGELHRTAPSAERSAARFSAEPPRESGRYTTSIVVICAISTVRVKAVLMTASNTRVAVPIASAAESKRPFLGRPMPKANVAATVANETFASRHDVGYKAVRLIVC